jgi:hypothetical protein
MSVAREAYEPQGRLTEILERKTQAHANGGVSASTSPTSLRASAEAGIGGSISSSKKLKISAKVQFMIVTNSKTKEGHYRWLVEPSTASVLEGRPWDAAKQPRLKLIDLRKDRSKGIPPAVSRHERGNVQARNPSARISRIGVWHFLRGAASRPTQMRDAAPNRGPPPKHETPVIPEPQ